MTIIYIALCCFLLPLHIFFMPLAVKFLLCSRSAVFYVFGVHGNCQLRKLEQLRNIIRLPVAYVLLHAFFHIYAGLFTFDHDQRNTIHKQNDIWARIFTVGTLHRKLICNLPDIIFRVFPVNIGNIKGLRVSVIEVYVTALTINQSIINRFAGKHQTALQWRIQIADRFTNGIIRERRLHSSVSKRLRGQKLPQHFRKKNMRKMAALLLGLCSGNILISHCLKFFQCSVLGFWTLIKNLMIGHI